MRITGTFGRFISRNEQTGESVFSLMTDDGQKFLFHAVIIPYRYQTPLEVKSRGTVYSSEDGTNVIDADDVSAYGYSETAVIDFISGRTFRGIGRGAAAQILKASGTDVFTYARAHEGHVDFNIPRLNDKDLNALFSGLYWYTAYEDTLQFIRGLGGSFETARGLFLSRGRYAISDVRKNPYSMAVYNSGMDLCEKLAKKLGFTAGDPRRIRAVTANAMHIKTSMGYSVVNFNELCRMVHYVEDESGYYHTDRMYIAAEVLDSKYRIIKRGNDLLVAGAAEYTAERRIADNIRRLLYYSSPLPNREIKEDGISYSEGQKKAFALLSATGVKAVTGGPGTGKTTVLNGLLKQYEYNNPGKEIALCAPTGCAAKRMTDATGRRALTVHKLLGIRPYENIGDPSPRKLDADLIIVDESSMLDIFVAARLLSAVKDNATVILVGDADQLPSVAPGAVFRDIIASNVVQTVALTEVFRQDKRSDIIGNSKAVLNGEPSVDIKTGPTFVIRRFSDSNLMRDAVIKAASKRKDDFRLFSPTKKSKFPCGTIALNNLLRVHGEDSISYGEYVFSTGDRVIFNRNDYDKGFYNGQTGVVTNTQKIAERVIINVRTDDEDDITLENEEISSIELAYAITAHKSQGSECETALIVIPKEPKSMLKRQLLYVEITRARKNVALFVEQDALEDVLSRNGIIKRDTLLKDILTGDVSDQPLI